MLLIAISLAVLLTSGHSVVAAAAVVAVAVDSSYLLASSAASSCPERKHQHQLFSILVNKSMHNKLWW